MKRTVLKHTRVYVDGYDMSGYSRSLGPLIQTYDETDLTTILDAVKGVLPAHVQLGIGTLNGIMDNTDTVGMHAVLSTAGIMRTVMIPIGIGAAPAAGDPVYCGQFEQQGYYNEGPYVTLPFAGSSAASTPTLPYSKPWGVLLHPRGTETAANDQTGIDDHGAATSAGGYMVYQIFGGDGDAEIYIEEAATNSDEEFDVLSPATTGMIDCTTPSAGIVPLATSAAVKRYLRWQIELDEGTTEVEFALAFVRALF